MNNFGLTILSFTIALLLFFISCKQANKRKEVNKYKIPTLDTINEKEKLDTVVKMKLNLLNFEDSFVGKTNLDFKDNKYHTCLGTVIDKKYTSSNGEFAISIIARKLIDCNAGQNKIILEKFLRRENRKAIFEVIDEMIVESRYPELCYFPTSLRLNENSEEKIYLLAYKNNQKKMLEDIFKLWEVDFESMKFKIIDIQKGLNCENPDYAEGL